MGAGAHDISFFQSYKNIYFYEWSELKQNKFLDSLDVGLMPLDKSVWSTHRDYFKIALYSSRGIPVIAHSNQAHEYLSKTDINLILSSFKNFDSSISDINSNSFSDMKIYKSRVYAYNAWSREAVFKSFIDLLKINN